MSTKKRSGDASISSASAEIDTGLLSLLILARFLGVPADGDQLRHQYSESGKVLSDTDLLRGAKHLGLKAGRVKPDWPCLAALPLPAIARRKDGRYLVLAKIEGEKALVQDPIEGRSLVLTRRDFQTIWSGHLILLTKRAPLRPQDLAFGFTWFIPAIVKYRRLLGELLLASFFLQIFALLMPLFTQVVIDKVLVHKGVHDLACAGDRDGGAGNL
jgi:subfamily B ATP-binding cassette protein HlyB/CyaB